MFKFFRRKGKEQEKQLTSENIIETSPRSKQQLTRGPKKLYSENLDYNIQLLLRRLPDPQLVIEHHTVGHRPPRKLAFTYLKDLANPGIVNEVRDRIKNVKTRSVLYSSHLERAIEDSHISPFPQIEKTSKPDITESALLQGRVAIFLDDSSDILLAPATFFDIFDTPDDVLKRWSIGASFYRIVRFIMFLFAAFLPAFYVALTSVNPELIPTVLAFQVAAFRAGLPFPVYLEAFIMMGVAESVRLVMLRLPPMTSQIIPLFTGLTLVGAALYAQITSPVVVIVATLAVLSSYAIPDADLRLAIRLIQFATLIMASFLGIFGLAISFIYIFIHLAVLKSFGVPYMTPLAPIVGSGLGHTVLRENTESMQRDKTYKPQNEGD